MSEAEKAWHIWNSDGDGETSADVVLMQHKHLPCHHFVSGSYKQHEALLCMHTPGCKLCAQENPDFVQAGHTLPTHADIQPQAASLQLPITPPFASDFPVQSPPSSSDARSHLNIKAHRRGLGWDVAMPNPRGSTRTRHREAGAQHLSLTGLAGLHLPYRRLVLQARTA